MIPTVKIINALLFPSSKFFHWKSILGLFLYFFYFEVTSFWFLTCSTCMLGLHYQIDLHVSHMDNFHTTWRHLPIFLFTKATTSQFVSICLIDLLWISPCFNTTWSYCTCQIDLIIFHTWIPSIQPGDLTFSNLQILP